MRHRLKGRKLGKTTAHRQAMERNMVTSLFVHGRIMTTVDRAKEFRAMAEHLITLGKKGGLAAFRAILDVVRDPKIAKKIVNDVAKRFEGRPGGYTRVVKLGGCRWDGQNKGWYAWNRLGDNGSRAIWELVERKEPDEEIRLAGRGKLAIDAGAKRKAEKKKAQAAAATAKK
ncbi:MAG TPA: 50S ribosomal protein L17 [Planctomycetota bacterium]|nr:50S ribosomal protein L17 [Planctomycetota bacterium]